MNLKTIALCEAFWNVIDCCVVVVVAAYLLFPFRTTILQSQIYIVSSHFTDLKNAVRKWLFPNGNWRRKRQRKRNWIRIYNSFVVYFWLIYIFSSGLKYESFNCYRCVLYDCKVCIKMVYRYSCWCCWCGLNLSFSLPNKRKLCENRS